MVRSNLGSRRRFELEIIPNGGWCAFGMPPNRHGGFWQCTKCDGWCFVRNAACIYCGCKREIVGNGSVWGPGSGGSSGFVAIKHDFQSLDAEGYALVGKGGRKYWGSKKGKGLGKGSKGGIQAELPNPAKGGGKGSKGGVQAELPNPAKRRWQKDAVLPNPAVVEVPQGAPVPGAGAGKPQGKKRVLRLSDQGVEPRQGNR